MQSLERLAVAMLVGVALFTPVVVPAQGLHGAAGNEPGVSQSTPDASVGNASGGNAPASSTTANDAVRRGEYLALAGDCTGCHTQPGGKPFAGGVVVPTPAGAIVGSNITPSKTAGIGHYTLEQFADAVRRGVDEEGRHLYPAMPYTAYAKLTDDDIAALYAYFMHGVAPVDTRPARTALPFPFDQRWAIGVWNALFLDRAVYRADPQKDAQWNRGAYLVQGAAHCGTCHTPRNVLMAESNSRFLGGGKVGSWNAPNITSDANSGIGGWSDAELVAYLAHGDAHRKAQAAGPMAEAIDNSLRHMREEDLTAMVAYLRTVPAIRNSGDARPAFAWGSESNQLATLRGFPLPQDPEAMSGAQLYDAWCATCHQASAEGSFDGEMPPLFHNTGVGSADTDNLVMVMLEGIERMGPQGAVVLMPAFAQLSDRRLATLGSWLTKRYGNPAAAVTAEQVSHLRNESDATLVMALRTALVLAVLLIAWIALAVVRRHRRKRV
jgi:mono/diheme cytochrome c family protein